MSNAHNSAQRYIYVVGSLFLQHNEAAERNSDNSESAMNIIEELRDELLKKLGRSIEMIGLTILNPIVVPISITERRDGSGPGYTVNTQLDNAVFIPSIIDSMRTYEIGLERQGIKLKTVSRGCIHCEKSLGVDLGISIISTRNNIANEIRRIAISCLSRWVYRAYNHSIPIQDAESLSVEYVISYAPACTLYFDMLATSSKYTSYWIKQAEYIECTYVLSESFFAPIKIVPVLTSRLYPEIKSLTIGDTTIYMYEKILNCETRCKLNVENACSDIKGNIVEVLRALQRYVDVNLFITVLLSMHAKHGDRDEHREALMLVKLERSGDRVKTGVIDLRRLSGVLNRLGVRGELDESASRIVIDYEEDICRKGLDNYANRCAKGLTITPAVYGIKISL